jgi:L-aminoacid ligase-like protein
VTRVLQLKELRSSWDRVAFVTACSVDAAEALRRARQAIGAIRIEVARETVSSGLQAE